MFREHEPLLFLSKDKKHLLDQQDNLVAEVMGTKGHTYYRMIGVESEAYEKICTEIKPRSICIVWNEAHECLLRQDVDICTQYELVTKGFSNIS